MKLTDLLKYNKIVIQCHDNPDADAIASGFALYTYFTKNGIDTRLIYSGSLQIHKSNLLLMIRKLSIPIEYIVPDSIVFHDELLITVDCQYRAGNVTFFQAENTAIIDHHKIEVRQQQNTLIMSNYGSCSTIVWQLLTEAGIHMINYRDVSTALYYGLFTDTQQFSEIYHPADKDMRDILVFSNDIFYQLQNCNLSAEELEIAGIAMLRMIYNDNNRYSLIKSQPCDPNILGLISDMCIQVDNVDTCVVYNQLDDGIKFSVRSCVKETNASDFAAFLAKDIGSGGGHSNKAGGFISRRKYETAYPGYHTEAYFSERIQSYFKSFDLIYAKKARLDVSGMKKYRKKHIPLGYVIPSEILDVGTPITIRSLSGDFDMVISDDVFIMIGHQGEVYTTHRALFEDAYTASGKAFKLNSSYKPTLKNRVDGNMFLLEKHVHSCVQKGETIIYASILNKAVKVFTKQNEERYMLGNIGDIIAVRCDDLQDVFVLENRIFYKMYEEL